MEVNNSGEWNPDKAIIGWTLDENKQDPERPKSYTCAFCKRGFSNAQALGGHMNIHRRDRAKLKQASEELSLDTRGDLKDLDEGNTTPKRADNSLFSIDIGDGADDNTIGEEVDHEEISGVHLSLSIKVGDSSSTRGVVEEKKMQLSEHFAQSEMVDLELRLGPEPHDQTSRKSTTDN